MAELTACLQCGESLGVGAEYCGRCSYDQSQGAPTTTESVTVAERVAEPPADRPIPLLTQCSEPSCGADLVPGATGCRYCGTSVSPDAGTAAHVLLRGPGGRALVVGPDGLRLGRDPGRATGAAAFDEFPNVSRLHALVSVTAGQAFVTDLGSMNGTFVNGRRLIPHDPCVIADGDDVRLAADLTLRITIDEERQCD